MKWYIKIYNLPIDQHLLISNISIDKSTSKINSGTFKCSIFIPVSINKVDTVLDLYCNDYIVCKGYRVIKCADDGQGRYNVDIEEYASALYSYPLKSSGSIFLPNVVITPKSGALKKTINNILYLLTNTYNGSNGKVKFNIVDINSLGALTHIPLLPNIPIPTLEYGHMMLGTAITSFIRNTLGLEVWFKTTDYSADGSVTITLSYGFNNSWITDWVENEGAFIKSEYTEATPNELSVVDKVVVISEDKKSYGVSGIDGGRQVNCSIIGNYTSNELTAFATEILKEAGVLYQSYKLIWDGGKCLKYNEGSMFKGLGDQTDKDVNKRITWKGWEGGVKPVLNESYYSAHRNDFWKIKDIRITEVSTEIIIGATKMSIFDIYKNKLTIIDGIEIPKTEVVVSN